MAFKAGTVTYFALDNAAGAVTNLSGYMNDVGAPQSTGMLDVSVFGTAAKAFIPGQTNGDTISIKGPYDVTLYSHITGLIAAQNAGTASHSFLYGPGGSVSGQAKISGECLVASFEPPSSVAGRVEWSASLQVTGAVANSTF